MKDAFLPHMLGLLCQDCAGFERCKERGAQAGDWACAGFVLA